MEKEIVDTRDEVTKSQGLFPGNGIHGREGTAGNGVDGMGCSPHDYLLCVAPHCSTAAYSSDFRRTFLDYAVAEL